MPDIKDLTKKQLVSWLETEGLHSFRAGQIFKWIYLRQADSFEVMTDIGKDVRKKLSSCFAIKRLDMSGKETSKDGTRKYLFRLEDGNHIESVLLPEKNHYTLCISSQAGCAQGCRFCLTARNGLKRNLTAGEIVSQIRDVRNDIPDPNMLTNIVMMGMGEPLANYENVINALSTITDGDHGLQFSTRRVTISTAGLVDRFQDLGRDTKVSLAVSLNATDNKIRSMLMPVNRKFPMEMLIEACKNYPLPHRRKITIEYILIKGLNDSADDANKLAKLLRPLKAKINLIPFNEHEGSEFKRPDDDIVHRFEHVLHDNGYTTIIRFSKGRDISAACGQLGAGIHT